MNGDRPLSMDIAPASDSAAGNGCVLYRRNVSMGPVAKVLVIDGPGSTANMKTGPRFAVPPQQAGSQSPYVGSDLAHYAPTADAAASAGSNGFARLAALTRPTAYRVLSRLSSVGTIRLAELEEELKGAQDWIAVAQLMRTGYATEGRQRLHITSAGRMALQELRDKNPSLPR